MAGIQVPNPYSTPAAVERPVMGELHEAPKVNGAGGMAVREMMTGKGGVFEKLNAWQAEFDKTRSQDLITRLEEKRIALRSEWSQLEGENALKRPGGKSLQEEIDDKFRGEYEAVFGEATSKAQRDALNDYYTKARGQNNDAITTHTLKQQQVYDESVRQRSLSTALGLAMSDDPNESASGIAGMRAVIVESAKRKGVVPDFTKYLGPVHAQKVGDFLDNNDIAGAKAYLKKNRGEMGVAQIAQSEKAIEAEEKQAAITAQSDDILEKYGDDRTAALKAALEIKDPETRDHVYRTVSAELSRRRVIEEAETDELVKNIAASAEKGEKIPAHLLSELESRDPAKYEKVQEVLAFQSVPNMTAAELAELRATTSSAAVIRACDARLKAMAADPMAYAGAEALNWNNPDKLREQLVERTSRASDIEKQTGSAPGLLTNNEKAGFDTFMDGKSPQEKTQMMYMVAGGLDADGLTMLKRNFGKNIEGYVPAAMAADPDIDPETVRLYYRGQLARAEKTHEIPDKSTGQGAKAVPVEQTTSQIAIEIDKYYDDEATRAEQRIAVTNVALGLMAEGQAGNAGEAIQKALDLVIGERTVINGRPVLLSKGLTKDDAEKSLAAFGEALDPKAQFVGRLTGANERHPLTGQALKDGIESNRIWLRQTGEPGRYWIVDGSDVVRHANSFRPVTVQVSPGGADSSVKAPSFNTDLSDYYNTELTAEEEKQYQAWARRTGRARDVFNYDLRGAWKEMSEEERAKSGRGVHLPDKFKKPNHYTFSDESKYSTPENPGGSWTQQFGATVFRPRGKYSEAKIAELVKYFEERERGVSLDLSEINRPEKKEEDSRPWYVMGPEFKLPADPGRIY
ncbi:hypothetical protein [Sutterella sp.]|uniref:hypothetical protein n=1 Tax=Sutterella sp. TaxID=1981025 RepID=UPI0026DFA14B|nr:hypothetical protein [Sutterella sp.]MDO5531066.1 hypothetical protein [Sutterella sp.]